MGVDKKSMQLPYKIPFAELKRVKLLPKSSSIGSHYITENFVYLFTNGTYGVETSTISPTNYGKLSLPDLYVIESIDYDEKHFPVMMQVKNEMPFIFAENSIEQVAFAIMGTEVLFGRGLEYMQRYPMYINYYTKVKGA